MPSFQLTVPLLMLTASGLLAPLYSRLSTLGAFRYPLLTKNIHGSEHHFISNSINCEDLHLDTRSGLLFTSCQAVDGSRNGWFPPLTRWENVEDAWKGDGGIYVVDPNTFTSTRLQMEDFPNIPFVTHGIDIIADPSNPSAIYIHAVNHLPNPLHYNPAPHVNSSTPHAASQIEVFHHEINSKTVRYIRSINHPLLYTPNDVFSLGPGELLVTNDHYYRDGHMRGLEEIGGQDTTGWTNIIHLNADLDAKTTRSLEDVNRWNRIEAAIEAGSQGVEAKVALMGLHNNNGLGHHPDPEKIIINDASGGKIYIGTLVRDGSNTLKIRVDDKTSVHHTIDNPTYFMDPYADPTMGANKSGILIPGLVNGLYFTADPIGRKGASIVSFLTPLGEKGWNDRILFRDDGELIKSASAAVLVPIDPSKSDAGKRQAWLFVTGFYSAGILAVKVTL